MIRRASSLAVLLLLVTACGSKQQTLGRAQAGLETALVATNAARDAMVAWDELAQLRIVTDAQTREEGEAKLADHRDKRRGVMAAFTTAYTTIALAATSLSLYESGSTDAASVILLLQQTAKAVKAAHAALEAFKE
jgi:hypothetical protein